MRNSSSAGGAKTTAVAATAVVLVLLGAFWMRPASSDGAVAYRTAPVQAMDLKETVEATGRLAAREPQVVSAPRAGRLISVEVQPGMPVEAGDVLAQLDDEQVGLEVNRALARVAGARAKVSRARAELGQAAAHLERTARLHDKSQASPAALEQASSSEATARASVQLAEADLREAEQTLASARADQRGTRIRAPRSGVVLTTPHELGQMATPNGPVLFRISAPLERLEVHADVGEADIGRLAVGQSASFEVRAFPGEWFEATVTRIGVVATRRAGLATYPITLESANPDGRLRPGMSAAVRFEVDRSDDCLAVKEAALRFQPRGASEAPPRSRVFKRSEDGEIAEIAVRTGVSDGAHTEVVPENADVLRAGDEVILGYDTGPQRTGPDVSLGGKR